jgi:hypothetical protein
VVALGWGGLHKNERFEALATEVVPECDSQSEEQFFFISSKQFQ